MKIALTIKEVQEFGALLQMAGTAEKPSHPFAGEHVICRCFAAGVHAGILVSQVGDVVHLQDSRRLWTWKVKGTGVALSGVAQTGLAVGSKLDVMNPEIILTGVIEIIPTAQEAMDSINNFERSSNDKQQH